MTNKDNRTITIKVRLSEEEIAVIQAKAKAARLSVSTFMRTVAYNSKVTVVGGGQ